MNDCRAWLIERTIDSPRTRNSPARNALSTALSGLVRIRLMDGQFDSLKASWESKQSEIEMQISDLEERNRLMSVQYDKLTQTNQDMAACIEGLE
ncbi:hypothetical protein K474DRAFT_1659443 [Panus rudis PR-1116 ss-1]|nr:hypothetical protein K474DRAFT_1659443 [Panus rudis PR-1116 ss-1]